MFHSRRIKRLEYCCLHCLVFPVQQISGDYFQDPDVIVQDPFGTGINISRTRSLCWRCGTQTGTSLRIFWEYLLLAPFWSHVLKLIHKLRYLPSGQPGSYTPKSDPYVL